MELLPPLLVQVGLTLILLLMMAYSRVKSIITRKVHPKDISLRQPNWPENVTRIGNAFHNQLEVPVVFYLLIVLTMITKQIDQWQVILAWAYVGLRLIHAAIHISTSRATMRFYFFALSTLVLIVMWVRFVLALYI